MTDVSRDFILDKDNNLDCLFVKGVREMRITLTPETLADMKDIGQLFNALYSVSEIWGEMVGDQAWVLGTSEEEDV